MSRISEFMFVVALLFGMVVMPVATVLPSPSPAVEEQADAQPSSDLLDRWFSRAAEYGVIGLVALWLLRIIVVDVKNDIKTLTQLLIHLEKLAERSEHKICNVADDIHDKLDILVRNVDRIVECRRRDNEQ